MPYMCIFAAGWPFCPVGPLAWCPVAMYTASYRHKIRKEFGITSSGQCVPGFSNDICVHFFCFPWALCQEHVELKSHLPFTPLKTLYDDKGQSLGVVSKKKKETFKWSFNLDELSDEQILTLVNETAIAVERLHMETVMFEKFYEKLGGVETSTTSRPVPSGWLSTR